MPCAPESFAAVVDYGLGNLFSVQRACQLAGLSTRLTTSARELRAAAAVILPGVGAFGDAMEALERRGLIGPLKEAAASGKPFIGVCLGMQLLMTQSSEFGRHEGLDLIPGEVLPLPDGAAEMRQLKVPHVGWNRIHRAGVPWESTPMEGIVEGAFMYFVHSYYVKPSDPGCILTVTQYGATTFCSSLQRGNLFGCQFHPERSGRAGLRIYRNFAARVPGTEPADA